MIVHIFNNYYFLLKNKYVKFAVWNTYVIYEIYMNVDGFISQSYLNYFKQTRH